MRILVIGGGSREHALLWKLARGKRTSGLWCTPGNAGTRDLADPVPAAPEDQDGIVLAAKQLRIDLVVIGPEAPLAAGLTDRLLANDVRVFGPTRAAARIESSKAWAKSVMADRGVPTARAIVVTDLQAGETALRDIPPPVVVKADGLAAGKGVVVAPDHETATTALHDFLGRDLLGAAGRRVLIEECLTGPEVSVLCICDGQTFYPLPAASDYKRAFVGDEGPNTGGMGAYAPSPSIDEVTYDTIAATILRPTLAGLADRGSPLRGVLYAGLMLTPEGPKVLEFNARFGDPETQVILPLLDADLAALLMAAAEGSLATLPPPPPATGAAVGVVLASGGYPGPYDTGLPITGLDQVPEDALVFHAGTKRNDDGQLVTAGGRVLTVVGRGATIEAARHHAYAAAERIAFPGRHSRPDIAATIPTKFSSPS